MWNLPPPPEFQGLHPDKPLRIYQRNMPHWRQEGATYFATFRLGDSLPQAKLQELERIREEFYHRHPPPNTDEELDKLTREVGVRVENWLDHGYGDCHLRHRQHADFMVQALHYFDIKSDLSSPAARPSQAVINSVEQPSQAVLDENASSTDFDKSASPKIIVPRYELDCYVLMANHVHAIVRPLDDALFPLESIIGSWKQFSAKKINRSLNMQGTLWQDEAFDRLIRDEEHLWRAIQYIGNNPKNAGVPKEACPLWIRPEWQALGWDFDPS